jgi:FtsP/CotA-like multicopper oxidase with cupredoxin domain
MQNPDLARDYIRRSKTRLLAVDVLFEGESWADVIHGQSGGRDDRTHAGLWRCARLESARESVNMVLPGAAVSAARCRILLAMLAISIAAACTGVGEPRARSVTLPCPPVPRDSARAVTPNDQTSPGGRMFGDTLDLQLEIGRGAVLPEGEAGPRLDVVTFGEPGEGLALPGPVVRTAAGTTVLARVCNTLADTVWLIGLANRGDTMTAPPGVVTQSVFTLDAPGIRVYHGLTREDTLIRPFGPTSTLGGAMIVDGEQRWGDQVLVLTEWLPDPDVEQFAMQVNGRSWPHTQRLRYSVGDTARWIVVNASPAEHPMHLHGFHFLVTARSTPAWDSVYDAQHQRLAVTEVLDIGASMSLEWVPERGGRWLFHCHVASHMDDVQRSHMMGAPPPPALTHGGHTAERAMAGLVVGIDVTGDLARGLTTNASTPVRRERLIVNDRPGVYPDNDPGLGYVLQRGDEPAADSIVVPGPPIVLTRGEPAEINVVNMTSSPTAVHWHGLEIESYYDGVPGWTGDDRRTTPLIAPGDSFLVRLAPRRAGTFIYHSHADELRQLGSGLFGPLVVLEPGQVFDRRTDHVLVFSMAGPNLDIAPIVANNGADPALELEAGIAHRIRIINITAEDLVDMEIRDANGPIPWRILALDGADAPAAHRAEHPSKLVTGPGQTVDVEIVPRAGNLRLEVQSFNNFVSTIRVRPAR